jgi:hypothetical protein
MTAVGKTSGRQVAVAWVAGSFGSSSTIQPPVPGDIRRGVGHIGLVKIPRTHDALIVSDIFSIAAEEFPGESWAVKLF